MDQKAKRTEFIQANYPELMGMTCGFCKQKYDGWGNNPAPLNIDKVCDDCNYLILQVRMGSFGGWRDIKKIQRMIEKQKEIRLYK